MKKNKGKVPCAVDVFFDTHSKLMLDGTRKVLSKKDQQILDAYEKEKARLEEQEIECDANKLYFDVVGGLRKGTVYGLGSASSLFFQPTREGVSSGSSSTATSYTPGIMAELAESRKLQQETQSRLDAQEEVNRKFREDTLKSQEELRRQFAMLQQQCNPHLPLRDPRDPFEDGSGAPGGAFVA